MVFPDCVLDVVRQATEANLDDIDAAVDAAHAGVTGLPDFDTLAADLVRHAVTELVYQARGILTHKIKKQNGSYAPPPVVLPDGPEQRELNRSLYDLCIGGRSLGSLTFEELPAVAEMEGLRARGHRVNEIFLRAIAPLGKGTQTVKERVTEKKLRQLRQKAEGLAAREDEAA